MSLRNINLLIVTATFLGCLALSSAVCVQLFELSLTHIIDTAQKQLNHQPQLTTTIADQNRPKLRTLLQPYLDIDAVAYAAVLLPQGKELAYLDRGHKPRYLVTPLATLRERYSPTEIGRHAHTTSISALRDQSELGWAGLLGGNRITTLSFPVHTYDTSGHSSKIPIAYLSLAIHHPRIWAPLNNALISVVSASVLLCLFSILLVNYLLKRYIKPLQQMSIIARNAADGKLDLDTMTVDEENRQVAIRLNTMISDLQQHKDQIEEHHNALSKKIADRTKELSRRNQELSQAVAEASVAKEHIQRMAYYDSLTSLPNRRLFTEQLKLMLSLANRHNHSLALLFFDLDNFKRINDSLGHDAGDSLLQEVASRLIQAVRESDIISHYQQNPTSVEVSRLGGDEFTVVLNQINSLEAVGHIAERLLNSLSQPMLIDGQELIVTPSIGIAIGPRDGGDAEALLKAADTAMHKAKQAGKNGCLFYSEDMSTTNLERLQLETDLRRAIERDQLQVYFQPQVELSTGTVNGLEALIRWQHPERGMVSPAEFIPIAEDIGIINNIGEWTTYKTCEYLQQLQQLELDTLPKIAINLSALEFTSHLHSRIQKALTQYNIPPQALSLELTESILIDTNGSTLNLLHRIKKLGVSLSIDDFGTGYSSLSYLSLFPLDELKIDRSFVIGHDKTQNSITLIKTIIAMGRSLGLKIVAEGVETEQQLRFLAENDVNTIQGYLFSQPVPFDKLPPLLTTGHFQPQIDALIPAMKT